MDLGYSFRVMAVGFVGCLFLLSGCPKPADDFVRFRELDEAQQMRVFKKLDLEKQIYYHVYSMKMEPPDTKFAPVIASQGPKVVPTLLQRMRASKPTRERLDLLLVFEDICGKFTCPKSLLDDLEVELRNIQDEQWREIGLQRLRRMETEDP